MRLPVDRLSRMACASPDEPPLVVIDRVRNALRLHAVDARAEALGLAPGLTLADAQARVPELRTALAQPDHDRALLDAVADDFDRFTPCLAFDEPDGLMLDVTGCAHLFGGEAGLAAAVEARLAAWRLEARLALASTPQAARAWSRFGPGGRLDPGQTREAARTLPIEALEASEGDLRALSRAGLKRLGDLDDRPSAALAARFGEDMTRRLRQTLGLEDPRITPRRAPPPLIVERVFAEPIGDMASVMAALEALAARLSGMLEERGEGARVYEATLFRTDRQTRRVGIETAAPGRDPRLVMRLMGERMEALADPVDPGFGFDQLRMVAGRTQAMTAVQDGLEARAPGTEAVDGLVDRLTARFGRRRVVRFALGDTHDPIRVSRLTPAIAGAAEAPPPDEPEGREPGEPPRRPLQLFDPPQPMVAISVAPDGPPIRFQWRRRSHTVARAEGPERISSEWWVKDQPPRDYYRVEDAGGRRFWIYRDAPFGGEVEPRWFVHGLFA